MFKYNKGEGRWIVIYKAGLVDNFVLNYQSLAHLLSIHDHLIVGKNVQKIYRVPKYAYHPLLDGAIE